MSQMYFFCFGDVLWNIFAADVCPIVSPCFFLLLGNGRCRGNENSKHDFYSSLQFSI